MAKTATAETAPAERVSSHGSASPDLMARMKALEDENARLRAGATDPDKPFEEYPKVKYKKIATSAKHPNGYEVRKVTAEQELALSDKWKDSPDEL